MPVFTSTEKYLMNKGKEVGIREATVQGIAEGLEQKFDKAGLELVPSVEKITSMKKLRIIQRTLWTAKSVEEMRTLIEGKKKTKN